MDECPPNCREDRERMKKDIDILFERSWPTWTRATLVSILAAIIGAIGSMYAMIYPRAEAEKDIQQVDARIERDLGLIHSRLERMEDKLDSLRK